MVCKNTLRIKHLPKELSDAHKEDFIRHFGAIKVRVITSKAKAKSVVYAKFESEDIAKNVMLRLHQLSILNCILCVEYAETDILQGQLATQRIDDKKNGSDNRFFKSFIESVNAFNDSVGFHQPPPSHLKYNYPKANRATINNIAQALATVPRFYIQVLHLMNKMNLPPPFAMPDPPVCTIPGMQTVVPAPRLVPAEKRKPVSESESEIESDGEGNKQRDIIPVKRVTQKKVAIKRPKFIKQGVSPAAGISETSKVEVKSVFDQIEMQPAKKIELKVVSSQDSGDSEKKISHKNLVGDSSETKTSNVVIEQHVKPVRQEAKLDEFEKPPLEVIASPKQVEKEEIKQLQDIREQDDGDNQKIDENKNDETKVDSLPLLISHPSDTSEQVPPGPTSPDEEFSCISLEELRANQVTDLSVMSIFKNYNCGEPTNKLYIKNCAKTVVVQDLEYIYNRYREESTKKPSEFNIRLMQEGRMKGQAFVTLDSVEQAKRAVSETNGFILKDKPLVVVFGKAGTKR